MVLPSALSAIWPRKKKINKITCRHHQMNYDNFIGQEKRERDRMLANGLRKERHMAKNGGGKSSKHKIVSAKKTHREPRRSLFGARCESLEVGHDLG